MFTTTSTTDDADDIGGIFLLLFLIIVHGISNLIVFQTWKTPTGTDADHFYYF